MKAKKTVSMKMVVLLLTLVLVLGCAAGGTFAWLVANTGPVTNTFTVGNINIELKEHDLKADGTLNTGVEVTEEDTYKILPGTTQPKDPFVRVMGKSEDCWVFVQVQELNNVAQEGSHKYVTWEIDNSVWTILNEANGVITYYASYTTQDANKEYNVLNEQKVAYGNSLTKEMIDKLYNSDGTIKTAVLPKLNFKAFAVQVEAGTDAAAAWAQVPASEYLGATP